MLLSVRSQKLPCLSLAGLCGALHGANKPGETSTGAPPKPMAHCDMKQTSMVCQGNS